jgi:acyl-CoA thioester hydrolase
MFTEIDSMGIVHHSNYLLWFEKGRRDFLRQAGASRSKIAERGYYLPLVVAECRFKSPAKPGYEIMVNTEIESMNCVKITFRYEVYEKKKRKLLAVGKTVHVWTDKRLEPVNIEKKAPDIFEQLRHFSDSEGPEEKKNGKG